MTANPASPIGAITGPTSGIGRATAQALSSQGYHLLLLCRNPDLGAQLRAQLPGTSEVVALELGDFANIAAAAQQIRERFPTINVLINNAGTLQPGYHTIDGIEAMMRINHLGHYLLTRALLPTLQATTGSRIVVVSSLAHRLAQLTTDDPLGLGQVSGGLAAYGRSKLANLIFARTLADLPGNHSLTCNALHPGTVVGPLTQRYGGWIRYLAPLVKPFTSTATQAAGTSVFLASSPDAAALNGAYLGPRQQPLQPSARVNDSSLQQALWQASEVQVRDYLDTIAKQTATQFSGR